MQKLTKSHGELLKPVKLYLNDLERIVELLQEVATDVDISTDEYTLTDLNQLSELKKEHLTFLELEVSDPYISFNLEPHQVWLFIGRDDMVSRGTFEKIKQVLVQRKRPLAWLLHSSVTSGLFTGLALGVLVTGVSIGNSIIAVLSTLALFLGVWWMWYGHKDRFKRYSIIIPKYRVDEPSFLKKTLMTLSLLSFQPSWVAY